MSKRRKPIAKPLRPLRLPTEIEPPRPRPCQHCGRMPDTLIVARRVTTYERHTPACPEPVQPRESVSGGER
jgi:hypothetical protein